MPDLVYYVASTVLVFGVLIGIYLMSKVEKAHVGNSLSAVSMALAIILTMVKYEVFGKDVLTALIVIVSSMLIGSAIGVWITNKVKMIQMPQMVALLNGFGGGASALVGALTLFTDKNADAFSVSTAMLALVVGVVTLVGSLVAAAKLEGIMKSKPVVLPGHSVLTAVSLIGSLAVCVVPIFVPALLPFAIVGFVLSLAFGLLFSIRVGGADMPITISLLNSFSGVAGAIAGLAIKDVLLVAVGGIVGASGLILTQIMCKAMNRSLFDILLGKTSSHGKKAEKPTEKKAVETKAEPIFEEKAPEEKEQGDPLANVLKTAKDVIFVPGYGMALAQAQSLVKQLEDKLEKNGANVRYAIHPVAGRMPGHMNVLLAEVDVPYEKLYEMKDINDDFKNADVAIVIGANDVMNPAAKETENTPISGMPILNVADAKNIIICNYDLKPGYAGVENPLYSKESGVEILLGDAKDSLMKLIKAMDADDNKEENPKVESKKTSVGSVLKTARDVIFVPGYGMALAQAQSLVKQLEDKLEKNGANVRYAIHPVAGRMPGHMNVLLAEVDVPYEKLYEMKDINDDFKNADVAIVIGANDVMNPAAKETENTPISGMPILNVADAKNIIICNYDLKPGYAGVENPLYSKESGVEILLGDAKDSLMKLISSMDETDTAASKEPKKSGKPSLETVLKTAKDVIFVPGYGMALAQAQSLVKQLEDKLEKNGANVRYAIHPVAGRMPGHMNVLLAEVDVPYEKLYEMKDINDDFKNADVAIVIGANDVMNPAAKETENTPISGMPILNVADAKNIIICNYDLKPGYAGVENPLYTKEEGVTLLLGDAKESLMKLLGLL